MHYVYSNLVYLDPPNSENYSVFVFVSAQNKRDHKISWIVNHSTTLCPTVLKFNITGAIWNSRGCSIVKIHFQSNPRWRMHPTFLSLNLCHSAADCSISFKCGTQYDNVTADTLQTFKVKESKVEVTVWRHVPAAKRYKTGVDRLTTLKLGENYPSAERNTWHMFKIKGSNGHDHVYVLCSP